MQMPGYYPIQHREPVGMAQVYPPSRSYSLAKLNMPRDHGIYEKVRVDNGQRRPNKMFEKLRRQQSYDENMYPRMMLQNPSRRPDGFDSLQLLGAYNDDRYLEHFMENNRGRTLTRESDSKKNDKNTLLSNKSKNSNTSSNSSNSRKKSKQENKSNFSISSVAMALIGSLASSSSVDNIYESVEQIHYRKTLENMNRREKIRDVQRSGHPLFDHLREERAINTPSVNKNPSGNSNTINRKTSQPAMPTRKSSSTSCPMYSSNSSGDEQEKYVRRNKVVPRNDRKISLGVQPTWRRAGSAGSESDDEWVIPRPKIGGRKRGEARAPSTDESDSSSKSSPMR